MAHPTAAYLRMSIILWYRSAPMVAPAAARAVAHHLLIPDLSHISKHIVEAFCAGTRRALLNPPPDTWVWLDTFV